MEKENVKDLSIEDREQIISMLTRISSDIASNTTIQKIINGTSFTIYIPRKPTTLVVGMNWKKNNFLLSFY